jgi:large subunit ribosomal protein L35
MSAPAKPKKTKMKTHKGAKKRFKITGTGKIMRTKGMKSHFRRRKAPRVKRQFDRMLPLDGANKTAVERMLPYGA